MAALNIQNLYQVAEVELIYKNIIPPEHRLQVTNSKEAYDILSASWDENRIDLLEQFKILLLKGNFCLGLSELATGGTAACPADPKMVMATALKANAQAIILAHNHPTGNLKPSQPDLVLTEKLFKAGQVLDIEVVDHIILSSHGYYSFGDAGVMPSNQSNLNHLSMF